MTFVASLDFIFIKYFIFINIFFIFILFLILGNVIVLPAFIHSNTHFSNLSTELSNERGKGTLPLGGLAAYLKVDRKLFEVHHFNLKFFHILPIQSMVILKQPPLKSSTKINDSKGVIWLKLWLHYSLIYPHLWNYLGFPWSHIIMLFSKDQFNTSPHSWL